MTNNEHKKNQIVINLKGYNWQHTTYTGLPTFFLHQESATELLADLKTDSVTTSRNLPEKTLLNGKI